MIQKRTSKPALLLLGLQVVLALTIGTNAQESAKASHLRPQHEAVLQKWLAHSDNWRVATLEDCNCDAETSEVRKYQYKDFHPYYAVGDFNNNGSQDFAVVLIHRYRKERHAALAVFNGPFTTLTRKAPAYFEEGLDLAGTNLFFSGLRPNPYRLLVGPFNSHGFILQPQGKAYVTDPPHQKRPVTPTHAEANKDIRQMDFLNFTYHPTICNQEIGISISAHVRNGEFRRGTKKKGVLFTIHSPRYGDLTSDGLEEAVIPAVCEPVPNNDAFIHEVFIYTLRNETPLLLAQLTDATVAIGYHRYYPDSNYHGVNIVDLSVKDGVLVVPIITDGPTCCPENIAWLQYRWNGKRLILVGRPQKTAFKG